ncbi:Phosphatidylinositol 3,5-bisphosphate-binding protein [Ascosphaera atra]|nr:Phosphatidylinositol 3,5-bisphosphate-binding protein [Ascosphaera atra]
MNTRPVIKRSGEDACLSATFNDDGSCFAVGLETGFCVFDSDPCELKASRDFNAGVGLAVMLGQTNYLALVGGGRKPQFSRHKMVIWDDYKQRVVITLEFPTPVLRACLSKALIVVALRNSIEIYAFSTKPQRKYSFETGDNPQGLVSLGPNIVAFPGRTPGQVQIVELENGNVSIIPAHEMPLKALGLSRDGSLLATAGEKVSRGYRRWMTSDKHADDPRQGTLIRVYATSNCSRIGEYRRGIDPAEIYSVTFNPSNSLLAVTSDKSTLHIFDLPTPQNIIRWQTRGGGHQKKGQAADRASNKWGFLQNVPLLPRFFSDTYSFATAPFELGDEPLRAHHGNSLSWERPTKGLIAWVSDEELLVISAGKIGRWEKFVVGQNAEGARFCVRTGWKKFFGG